MCERFGIVCIAACRRSRSRLVRLDRPCRRSRTRWRERQLGVASSIVRAFSRARRGWPRALLDPTTPPGHRGRDKLVSKIAGTAWRMTSADALRFILFHSGDRSSCSSKWTVPRADARRVDWREQATAKDGTSRSRPKPRRSRMRRRRTSSRRRLETTRGATKLPP